MCYLIFCIALVILMLIVFLSLKCRSVCKSLLNAKSCLEQSQRQIDELYRENLFLKNQKSEYTVFSDYEVKLLKTPPILDFVRKKYCPVIRFSGTIDNWKIILLGAKIYVEDWTRDRESLTVERCVGRISAEEYDDFLRQFQNRF